MRELTLNETTFVSGGATNDCGGSVTIGTSGANIQTNTTSFGEDVIAVYEGMISSLSYMIERVANSLR